MAYQPIIIGDADQKQGDNLFSGASKINSNFSELYGLISNLNNVVYVNSFADIEGLVVLNQVIFADNTTYIAGGDIISPYPYVMGANTLMSGNSPFSAAWVYTGTGTMIIGSNVNAAIDLTVLSAPNADVFNFSCTAGNGATLALNDVTIASCQSIGTMNNLRSLNWSNVNCLSATDGLNILGVDNWERLSISKLGVTTNSAAFIALDITGSLLPAAEVDNYNVIGVAGATGLKGDANNANVPAGSVFSMTRSEFLGGMTQLVGVTGDDVRFSFTGNATIPNSVIVANPYLTAATTVPINTIGVYEKVNQGNWSFTDVSRMTVSADGDTVNDLEYQIRVQVTGSITLKKSGGGSDLITARLVYDNDPEDSASIVTEMGTDSASPTNIGLIGVFMLDPTKDISLWVANQSSTASVIVDYAKISILRVL